MKFYSVTSKELDRSQLEPEYKAAHEIGVMRIGENHLFFRKMLKVYAIPNDQIKRCYRRVMMVPAKMCCGKGDLHVESIVIEDAERELAVIQMPGEKASKIAFEELKGRLTGAEFSCPPKSGDADLATGEC